MASKVSSGQSDIYRARMLPVVSSSAHHSLPRESRSKVDTQKTRSGLEVSGRKTQAHGFKPLFPLDTSNFVSKIVDRNSQDTKETKDLKPRLITPVSSSIARPSPYPKDTKKEEEETDVPPKVPPRKKLPHNPTPSKTSSSLPIRTERRSLPSPRTQNHELKSEISQPEKPVRRELRMRGNISGESLERKSQNSSEGTLERRRQNSSEGTLERRRQNSSEGTLERRSQNSSEGKLEKRSQYSVAAGHGSTLQRSERISNLNSGKIDKTYSVNSDQVSINTNYVDSNPLTRTNVTQHDKLWHKDEPKTETGLLVPPLQDITPETTEELWNNFDPLDVLDSGSDSSADTMIMMTTEEEQRNEQKIQDSHKQYNESLKFRENTEKPIEMGNHGLQNGSILYGRHSKDLDLSPKSSEEDDGYGTNSSTSTNFSSMSSLGIGDTEPKLLHGILKKPHSNMTNGEPVTYACNTSQNGPSQSTWAVRRRTKMAESQDNSLQEKLRQLAIIEEENTHEESRDERLGIVHVRKGSDTSNIGSVGYSSDIDSHWKSVVNSAPSGDGNHMRRGGRPSEEEEKQEEVIQNDLKKFEGELYDKLTDMDLNYRNYCGFDNGQTNEKDLSPKVLYFQQKMIKQQYGNDNYYNPSSYQSASNHMDYSSRAQTLPTQSHNMSKNMTSMPDLCRRAYSNDPQHLQNYGVPNGYESHNSSYRSLASHNSGQISSQDYINGSNDNLSVHSGHSMPGNLYKTKYVSVDNINQNGRRSAFASSADIYNLFQTKENLATQLQRPASYRHSFHAVPVSVLAGKNDPNHDIFNEKDEPRPRSSSTSVGSKTKSWNPFGGLFGKKRKNSQISENASSKTSDKQLSSKPGHHIQETSQIRQSPVVQNQQPEMLPRRQLVEENGPVVAPVIKSLTLPRHASCDKVFPDKPFKTVALFEESGTKLSTLV